jgi:leucyl-tRNA synthetase
VYRLVARHAEQLRGVQAAAAGQVDLAKSTSKEKILLRRAHQTLKRVTNDFEVRWHFNTSVALIMELVNELQAQEPLEEGASPAVMKKILQMLALMLAPLAPHLAEELWEMLGNSGGLAKVKWPPYRAELAKEEQFEVVIQINGRLRGKILVEDGLGEDELAERALADPRIAQLVSGKHVAKTVVVPRKLVNLVLQ